MLRFSVFICLFLGFGVSSYGADNSLGRTVEYELTPCCELCPEALDVDSYDTKSLRGVRLLKDGKDGWLFRSGNDFIEEFGPDKNNTEQLTSFINMLKQKGVDLSILYIPTRGIVHPDRIVDLKSAGFDYNTAKNSYLAVLDRFRNAGVIVPDMSPIFSGSSEVSDFFFKRDHHWTPSGARYSAKILADEIKKQPIYDTLKKTKFKTYEKDLMRRTGQLQLAAKRICGFDYPFQYVKNYATEPELNDIDETNAESVLFGDTDLPDVVLLGTSNSWNNRNDFNFSGFLKEYLGVDLLNGSIAGGNFDGSMLQYLFSDEYKKEPAKLLIWELPAYYDLNVPMFYRRARPMISGGCDHRTVVLESTTELKPGRNEVLFNGDGEVKRLKSKDLIIDLQFDNSEFRELSGYVWYVHGRREPIRMKVADRVDIQGRFIFETMATEEWENFLYLSTDIILPELSAETQATMPTSVTARMCLKDY